MFFVSLPCCISRNHKWKLKDYLQLQTDHQMALRRKNAAKLELSKAEERMEKAEAKLVDLKADELKKASSQRGEQTPTFQVPDLHCHSQQLQQPQQGANSDSRHTAPTESPLPFSQSVQLTSTDLNRNVKVCIRPCIRSALPVLPCTKAEVAVLLLGCCPPTASSTVLFLFFLAQRRR
ncbi:hypothetical protein CHARACLAT_033517 [Characodon lateralis]|uniref:Uncharacterized protein n=1 Tax=Characodon lateralis TaxID=208331 RepID=A0ABU7DQN5_9TELE|nr:hypothetical protein [Characodon lateralis]